MQKISSFLDSVVFSSVVSGKLGALRLKVRLVEDRILPSVYYQPLIHLLVESVISPTEVSVTVFLVFTDIHLLTCAINDVLSSDLIHSNLGSTWFINSVSALRRQKNSLPISAACCDKSSFSPGGGQQCSDHAGGGDHGREPAGCGDDPGEDLPGPGPGGAIPGLP